MRILITGSTGMVGRNLVEKLSLGKDYQVVAPTRNELDLMNFSEVLLYFRTVKPDLVIHCAGLVGGIQANISRPTDFLVHNLEIGKNVVLASHETEVKNLLNLGSSCMYPKDLSHSLKEKDLLTGVLEPTNEGYALSKIVTAKLCEYISKEFPQKQYKTLIPCNLYGPWDKFDPENSHMIPSIIMKLHESKKTGEPVEIWGDGSARREFMHVQDLIDFIFFSISNFSRLPACINVGLGHDYTVLEYYQIAAKVVGVDCDFVFDKTKPVGMKRKLLDVSLASSLGWSYKMSLEEGIRNTYYFYQKVYT